MVLHKMEYMWADFLVEGDKLYDILVNNFESMFDDNIIKHFRIRDNKYLSLYDTIIKIKEQYENDIRKELLSWIRNELNENQLFKRSNWKPFRDSYTLMDMYHGYKKLFTYKNYYFKLGMETNCDLDECIYCGHTKDVYFEEHEENSQHFILDLYGWKDDNSDNLMPYRDTLIPIDNILTGIPWEVE
jgi:hypothetical protein